MSVRQMICQCGGTYNADDTTAAEEKAHGCGRPGCCLEAIRCDKCGVRILVVLEAPELERGDM